jgi:hypothetical protein
MSMDRRGFVSQFASRLGLLAVPTLWPRAAAPQYLRPAHTLPEGLAEPPIPPSSVRHGLFAASLTVGTDTVTLDADRLDGDWLAVLWEVADRRVMRSPWPALDIPSNYEAFAAFHAAGPHHMPACDGRVKVALPVTLSTTDRIWVNCWPLMERPAAPWSQMLTATTNA